MLKRLIGAVIVLIIGSGLTVGMDLAQSGGAERPRAELLHFREGGRADGRLLLPAFKHHSIWSSIGVSRAGQIYAVVSNHARPYGNAAVYRFDPTVHEMHALGDIRSTSQMVDNWMAEESQFKVHTFLLEHADGRMYFASDDYEPTHFLRGAHLYAIDTASNELIDVSRTQTELMTRALEPEVNRGVAAERSGIFVEYYGIKGIGLNPASRSRQLYAMTYPDGHLIHYDLETEKLKLVGQSPGVAYVFYVSPEGHAYYAVSEDVDNPNASHALMKYNVATRRTTVVAKGLGHGEIGAIAPNADHTAVWLLFSASKAIYVLDPGRDSVRKFAIACGSNWWRLYNMTLSPDGKHLYFVSNNNEQAKVWKMNTRSRRCEKLLDIEEVVGSRNLAFGGVNVWDHQGSFYVPVWTHQGETPDAALLRIWPE